MPRDVIEIQQDLNYYRDRLYWTLDLTKAEEEEILDTICDLTDELVEAEGL